MVLGDLGLHAEHRRPAAAARRHEDQGAAHRRGAGGRVSVELPIRGRDASRVDALQGARARQAATTSVLQDNLAKIKDKFVAQAARVASPSSTTSRARATPAARSASARSTTSTSGSSSSSATPPRAARRCCSRRRRPRSTSWCSTSRRATACARSSSRSRWCPRSPRSTMRSRAPASRSSRPTSANTSCRSTTTSRRRTSSARRCTRARRRSPSSSTASTARRRRTSIEELCLEARGVLREHYLTADMGISGGNFFVAETGSVVLVTNEGNATLTTTLPKVHVAISGIEKIVPTLEDVATLMRLLPRSATGQSISNYVDILTGPKGPGEFHGVEHMYFIIVDSGRTEVLGERREGGAALHPLRRVHEPLPGLPEHRRPFVRLGLPGTDRLDPDADVRRPRERARPAAGVDVVQPVRRRVPGQDPAAGPAAQAAREGVQRGPAPVARAHRPAAVGVGRAAPRPVCDWRRGSACASCGRWRDATA